MKEKLFKWLFPDYYLAHHYLKNELVELRFKNKIVVNYGELPNPSNHKEEIWECVFEYNNPFCLIEEGKYLSDGERWLLLAI